MKIPYQGESPRYERIISMPKPQLPQVGSEEKTGKDGEQPLTSHDAPPS